MLRETNGAKPMSDFNLDDLTLDNLFSEDWLKPSTLAKSRCVPLKNEKEEKKYYANGEIPDVPWHPTELIIQISEISCAFCGSTWEAPHSAGLMVRFKHNRKDETWTTTRIAGNLPRDLPIKEEYVHATVGVCRHCVERKVETMYQEQSNEQ